MTLTEINNSLTIMGRQVKDLADRQMAGEDLTHDIDDLVSKIENMTKLRDVQMNTEAKKLHNIEIEVKDMNLKEMLKSNEYAQAFAYAIKNGINPRRGAFDEKCKILYDALTIGGGSPAGEDGGFLVPEDIANTIVEVQRDMVSLASIVNVENVTANSGWRVMDTAPTTAMTNVSEMASIATTTSSSTEQPLFVKVPYTLAKYAEILPVSNELAADEVAGLFAYISRFIAKRVTLTENSLIKAQLPTTVSETITSTHEVSGLKKVLNKHLDPAHAANAVILTNQSGFQALDAAEDTTGRPLVNISPIDGTPRMFGGKQIVVMSDSMLANGTNVAPIYVGDFKQYVTLFQRNPVEILSTNIGGAAFDTDSTQVRYIKRMAAVKFDTAAVKYATIAI